MGLRRLDVGRPGQTVGVCLFSVGGQMSKNRNVTATHIHGHVFTGDLTFYGAGDSDIRRGSGLNQEELRHWVLALSALLREQAIARDPRLGESLDDVEVELEKAEPSPREVGRLVDHVIDNLTLAADVIDNVRKCVEPIIRWIGPYAPHLISMLR